MKRQPPQRSGWAAPRGRGFSLLEMLLAVLVFGLMASAAYGVLNSLARAASAQAAAAERLRGVQLAVVRMERELRQALSAGMFSSSPGQAGLQGGPGILEFRYLASGSAAAGPAIRQMHYRLEDRTLVRLPIVPGVARPADLESRGLLDGVTELGFSYLDAAGNWQSRWPADPSAGLPAAVRLDMEIDGFGHVERLFELPGDRP